MIAFKAAMSSSFCFTRGSSAPIASALSLMSALLSAICEVLVEMLPALVAMFVVLVAMLPALVAMSFSF